MALIVLFLWGLLVCHAGDGLIQEKISLGRIGKQSELDSLLNEVAESKVNIPAHRSVIALETAIIIGMLERIAQDSEALILFDYDGVLGRGTGHDDDPTPSRFENGQWKPRCDNLLSCFIALRDRFPKRVHIFSNGNLFFLDRQHYLREGHAEIPEKPYVINESLYYWPMLGFWTISRVGDSFGVCPKRTQMPHVVSFLATQQNLKFKRVFFVDDFKARVDGVEAACCSLGLECCCVWLPHLELEPNLFRPPSPDGLSIQSDK